MGGAAPDLDALVRTSVQRGGRIRRARLAAAGLGAAAVVVAGSLGVAALAGGTPSADTSFADGSPQAPSAAPSSSAPPLAVGDVIAFPSNAKGNVYELGKSLPAGAWPDGFVTDEPVPGIVVPSDSTDDNGLFVVAPYATDADIDWFRERYADSSVTIVLATGRRSQTNHYIVPTPTTEPSAQASDATSELAREAASAAGAADSAASEASASAQ